MQTTTNPPLPHLAPSCPACVSGWPCDRVKAAVAVAFKATVAKLPGALLQDPCPFERGEAGSGLRDYLLAAFVPDAQEATFIAAMGAAGVHVTDRAPASAVVSDPSVARGYRIFALRPDGARLYIPTGTLDSDAGHAILKGA